MERTAIYGLLCFMSVLHSGISQNLQLSCPSGWTSYLERCYLVVTYKHSYNEALNYCNRNGATLVKPTGYDISNWVAGIVRSKSSDITSYWIGYKTSANLVSGSWADGTAAQQEVGVWGPYQPTHAAGSDCVYVTVADTSTDNSLWYAGNCQHVLASVCELVPCPTGMFQCSNGNCVGSSNVCDQQDDCGDLSDERDCNSGANDQCTYYLTGTSGTVRSPNNPSAYLANAHCIWTIETPPGSYIEVTFNSFRTEKDTDFLEIFDRGPTLATSVLTLRLSGEQQERYTTIYSSSNFLIARFVSDAQDQFSGFEFTWSASIQCKLLKLSNMRQTVNGDDTELTSSRDVDDCKADALSSSEDKAFTYREEVSSSKRFCNFLQEVGPFVEDTCCDAYIKTCPSLAGIQDVASIPSLPETLTAPQTNPQQLYTPFYPLFHLGNMEVTHTITGTPNSMITLRILDVDLCCNDVIHIFDGDSVAATKLLSIDKNSSPTTVISTGNTMHIYMYLDAHLQCKGVLMTYVEGCDLELTESSGEIISPGYDVSDYPGIAFCTWKIITGGRNIQLRFDDFDLENNMDFLKVYDGQSEQGTAKHPGNGLTGSSLPSPVSSDTGEMFVVFTSSAITSGGGFKASYSAGCSDIDTSTTNLIASPKTTGIAAGDIIQLACSPGYFFTGEYYGLDSVSLNCMTGGSWDGNIPTCARAFCGFASSIADGYIMSGTGVLGGHTVTYACNDGYTLVGQTTITCQSNSTWSTQPTCRSLECTDRHTEPLTNGTITRTYGDGIHHRSVLSFSCTPTYFELYGPSSIACLNGVWTGDLPSCEKIQRSVPDIAKVGSFNPSQATYLVGDVIGVVCVAGFQVSGKNPFTYGIDTTPSCSDIDECAANSDTCSSSVCENTDGGYNCICHDGYQFAANSNTFCEDINECSVDNGYCDQTCTNTLGGYTCTCDAVAGFALYTSNGFQGLTSPDGDGIQPWHRYHINHTCVPVKCDLDLTIVNGQALTSKQNFFYGESVEFLCDIRYTTDGTANGPKSKTLTCLATGSWDSQPPTCQEVSCSIDFAGDTSNVSPSGSIAYSGMYTLQCTKEDNSTYTLNRYCGYHGDMNIYATAGETMSCLATDCGTPPAVKGAVAYTGPTTYSNSFQFRCDPQYERAGTSPNNDNIVTCSARGIWEYGTLYCKGGQCPDPGVPVDGETTVTDLSIGSVITYTCLKTGFEPDTHSTATCEADGNGVRWNPSTTPTCIDKTKPQWFNCPGTRTIKALTPNGYTPPTATDNLGILGIYVSPQNFGPDTVMRTGRSITTTAVDYHGNLEVCTFNIEILDETPPIVTCNNAGTTLTVTSQTTQTVDPTTYASTNEGTLSASPALVTLSPATIGTFPVVNITATDDAGNRASCTLHFTIRVDDKCKEWALAPLLDHASATCQDKTSGSSGLLCTVSCDSGYVFYEDPDASTLSIGCNTGGDWDRAIPVCTTVRTGGWYRFAFYITYNLQGTIDSANIDSCRSGYETNLEQNTNLLTQLNGVQCPNITAVAKPPTTSSVSFVELVNYDLTDPEFVYVYINLQLIPFGLAQDDYVECKDNVLAAMVNLSDSINSLDTLAGFGNNCPSGSLQQTTLRGETGHICENGGALKQSQTTRVSKCVSCPMGMYQAADSVTCTSCGAGTYQDQIGQSLCKSCPAGTGSLVIGAKNSDACYGSCIKGMYSATGAPPCSDCPLKTYWTTSQGTVNTACASCPSPNGTYGTGHDSVDDCRRYCGYGTYSSTGFEPCTECPQHFAHSSEGQTSCLECAGDRMTRGSGSPICLSVADTYTELCPNGTCQNGGTCSVSYHKVRCGCPQGYTGDRCETEANPCDSSPCYNKGLCTKNSPTSYNCACRSTDATRSYQGDRCESISTTQCEQIPTFCQNNGTCVAVTYGGSASCACSPHNGYEGITCETTINICQKEPCENGGTCVAHANFHRSCQCPRGYQGLDCGTNIDDCDANPCINNGTCTDGVNDVTCACPTGFTGKYCHLRQEADICSSNTCGTNSLSCIDVYYADQAYCTCNSGYDYDSTTMQCSVKDNCAGVNCSNGNCVSYDGGFNTICDCQHGYGGSMCTYNIDDCASQPCNNGGDCTDLVNDYSCDCTTAGTGGKNCDDNVDDCASNTCVADNTQRCDDGVNNYMCVCVDGYEGTNCETKTPLCPSLPCQHDGTCTETVTSFSCACVAPWTGTNCESTVDNCNAGGDCSGGNGTCYNYNNGFVCDCASDYIGSECETTYDLCERTSPCIGDGSTCVVENGVTKCSCGQGGLPECACALGYTGQNCESSNQACDNVNCQNGGVCRVVGTVASCSCATGYTGTNCETDIDECSPNQCNAANEDCVQGTGSYTCVCKAGRYGENCDKTMDYDFDFIVMPSSTCDVMPGIVRQSSSTITGLTVAFWVRFISKGTTGTILTMYGSNDGVLSTSEPFMLKFDSNKATVSYDSSLSSRKKRAVVTEELFNDDFVSNNITDGYWHHVMVSWTTATNPPQITLYIDGSTAAEEPFDFTSLPSQLFIILGAYDLSNQQSVPSSTFQGRVSRLFIFHTAKDSNFASQLYNNRNLQPSDNILEPALVLLEHYMVDFNSQLTNGICTDTSQSCDKVFDASTFPTITDCPSDQFFTGNGRESSPSWTTASFSGADSTDSNKQSGTTLIGWGIYAISTAAYKDNSNTAVVCTYRIFNQREACTNAANPSSTGGSPSCTNLPDGQRCTLSCTSSSQLPSQQAPLFYSCSKYGMWDQQDRLVDVDFRYPSCQAASDMKQRMTLTVSYDIEGGNCNSQKDQLKTSVGNQFSSVNTEWNNGLCNGVDCSVISTTVTCSSTEKAVVSTQFPLISTTLSKTSPATTMNTVDVLKVAFADDADFTFSGVGSPDLPTFSVQASLECDSGSQIVQDKCVPCGPGTYHDSNTMTCKPCAEGSYSTQSGATQCTQCAGGFTPYQGSRSIAECYGPCFIGSYINGINSCQDCVEGFYQNLPSVFYCQPCGVGLTTAGAGSNSPDDCVDASTITSAPTTAPPEGDGNVGAATEGGTGLSGAEIAAIVIGILIFILIILILLCCCCRDKYPFSISEDEGSVDASTAETGLPVGAVVGIVIAVVVVIIGFIIVFCCCKERLPCFEKKEVEPSEKLKYVNRYGETNMKFVNYKLNDVREKRYYGDQMPIISGPSDDTASVKTELSIHVPVFMEKLDGKVHKKQMYMSQSGGHNSTFRSHTSNEIESDHYDEIPIARPHKKRRRRPASIIQQSDASSSTHYAQSEAPMSTVVPKPLPPKPGKHKPPSEIHVLPPAVSRLPRAKVVSDYQNYNELQQTGTSTSSSVRPPAVLRHPRRDMIYENQEDELLRTGTSTHSSVRPMAQSSPRTTARSTPRSTNKIQLDSDDEDLR